MKNYIKKLGFFPSRIGGVNHTIVFLSLVIGTVLIWSMAVWNAYHLYRTIQQQTEDYVADVAVQLTDSINFRVEQISTGLSTLVDTIQQVGLEDGSDSLHTFLCWKNDLLDFDDLFFLQSDGSVLSTSSDEIPKDFSNLDGVQQALEGKLGVSFLDDRRLLYSVPVTTEDGVTGVLSGIQGRENMRQIIKAQSFSGQGLTCIVNTSGRIVVAHESIDAMLPLANTLKEETPSEPGLIQMHEDLQAGKSGIVLYSEEGQEWLLAYNPLQSFDWILLTLVPSNLLSQQPSNYIAGTFLLLVLMFLLFLSILITVFQMSRVYYRHIEQIVLRDNVTGKMNNAAFQLACSDLIRSSPPNSYTVALLNLRNFKLINEFFGTSQGDETLRHILNVLLRHITAGELACRSHADNFSLCLKGSDPAVISKRLKEMIQDINVSRENSRQPYRFMFRQGAYAVDNPDLDITVIQDRALTACRATEEDSICTFYDAAFTQRIQQEHELNDCFEASLQNGDFQVFLQPKIWTENGGIAGAEALVRWFHPQRGLIGPNDFIPLFEKTGKICRLDRFVFEEVCRTIRRWLDEGWPCYQISVNLSRRHFQDPNFLTDFYQIAQSYRIPPYTIELELTESILLDARSITVVKEMIQKMREMGFLCSLDDFGTGFSSLDLLIEFDMDVIKLDRSLFLEIHQPKRQKIISAIAAMARSLGAYTVAEGIETEEQLAFVKKIRCDLVQGYIYSPPLPVPEFEEWAKQHQQLMHERQTEERRLLEQRSGRDKDWLTH